MAFRISLSCVLLALLIAKPGIAQQFEVASVRPNHSDSGLSGTDSTQPRFNGSNLSLRSYIRMAYAVSEYQVIGPPWLDSDRFDIIAKAPDGSAADSWRTMLQALLADRFQLRIHRETRDLKVYELRVAASGLKIKPAEGPGGSATNNGRGRLIVNHSSMARFAEVLSRQTEYPIVDRTNVPGIYDFLLEWTPDDKRGDDAETAGAPSLFTAIQEQLGLKLQSSKAPLDVLVVDSANRVPSGN